jgi:hypothetical protein
MRVLALSSIVCVIACPTGVLAQTAPTAFTERSLVVAENQDIHFFGLSTKDENGKVRCFDVAINLPINANGRPADSAPVTYKACPKVKNAEFVVGAYDVDDSTTICELNPSAFLSRTQWDLRCNSGGMTIRWYSGPIAGHPYEAELVAAGLDQVPGNQEYSWGKINFASGTYWDCFDDPELVAARQVGDVLTLTNYGFDNDIECQRGMLRVTP